MAISSWYIQKEDFEVLHQKTGWSKKYFREKYKIFFIEVDRRTYLTSLNVVWLTGITGVWPIDVKNKNVLFIEVTAHGISLTEL